MLSRTAFTAAALSAGVLLAPAAAFADPGTCDGYSQTCVKPTHIVKPPTEVAAEHNTLPFTGAEVVLMTIVGGGAIGAGAMLVVGGRRRRHVSPA